MANINRGITYVPLDLVIAKLYVFINRLFINNKDFSSQLGYKVILVNKVNREDTFKIYGNLID